ncbi:MAG: hypothetical protein WC992_07625 [Acholeplasmataceae bacterium]
MRPLAHDSRKPLAEAFALGQPGSWQVELPIILDLHDTRLAGLSGPGFLFEASCLYLHRGYRWDGSSGVRDSEMCLVASAFHDAAVEAIDQSDLGWVARWRLRRWADWQYGRICAVNGMAAPRAGGRFLGLRVLGPVFRVYRWWQRIVAR